MTRNILLKAAIFASGNPQREIARRAKMHETLLSHILSGRYTPDEDEKTRIAKALNAKVEDLFITNERVN